AVLLLLSRIERASENGCCCLVYRDLRNAGVASKAWQVVPASRPAAASMATAGANRARMPQDRRSAPKARSSSTGQREIAACWLPPGAAGPANDRESRRREPAGPCGPCLLPDPAGDGASTI